MMVLLKLRRPDPVTTELGAPQQREQHGPNEGYACCVYRRGLTIRPYSFAACLAQYS